MSQKPTDSDRKASEENEMQNFRRPPARKSNRRRMMIAIGVGAIVVIALAVVLGMHIV